MIYPAKRFPVLLTFILLFITLQQSRAGVLEQAASLPQLSPEPLMAARHDWMLGARLPAPSLHKVAGRPEIVLENGLIRRTFRLAPNGATVGLDNLMTGAGLIRSVRPEATVTLNGREYSVGGLRGQPDHAYLLPAWIDALTNAPGSFELQSFRQGPTEAPFPWKRTRHAANLPWPAPGVHLQMDYRGDVSGTGPVTVTVHYEFYQGLPVYAKWITVRNDGSSAVTLNRFSSEELAVVEADSAVDERDASRWRTPPMDVLSDYMFKGMDHVTGNQIASWETDPSYKTQVSYAHKTPCVLICKPPIGPAAEIQPGATFTSFRAFVVIHDSTERERQGLILRRAQRHLAPWTTENPIMMHVRSSETKAFRLAVDQCAETGFEMIIYTFGSGLNAENQNPEYIARIKSDVDYAHSKGIQVGAYSLFSSRRINDENDVINPATGKPGGAIFGNAPCFASQWGTNYFHKITNFWAQTGLDLLEHDGPYPGDICASTKHPGHKGRDDSQWVQWELSRNLYTWCRANGIYINQPDYYFFAGGNKTGMGYREDNWSLPRAQQLIHARQNIFDGTWAKSQSMGWMFVPLTEYHGGGKAATLEPLKDHLADYEGHLANTLGSGVQACWRGPRLYDSDETRDLVKKWVLLFKQHRDILESDVIHARRADGRDIDYLVHVNPALQKRAFTMIHNPLPVQVKRSISLPLYYTGLQSHAWIREKDGKARKTPLDRQGNALFEVTIPANGRTWLVVEGSRP